jgi:hypothetical protein
MLKPVYPSTTRGQARYSVPLFLFGWLIGATSVLLFYGNSVEAQTVSPTQETSPAPAPATNAPRLVFKESVYDFGKVEQGEQVNHLFHFTNQGERDLRIESVKTTCGCTAAVISADVIAPGKEGTISATFDTTRYFGEKAKSISVYSNDPLQPVTTLTLQGEIVVEIVADPPQVYLGRVRRGAATTQTVELLYEANKPIQITNVELTSPIVGVQAEDLEKDGKKGKKLLVTLKKNAPLGRVNDEIKVTTTSQKKPSLTIPVFGHIEGDLLVQPPQISFGVVRKGDSKTHEISIKSRATKPVHVQRVQSSAPSVVAEVAPVKDGEEYRLTLRVNEQSEPGQIRGEVQVFTDHPEEKVLTIPIYGMIADPQQVKK